MNKNQCIKACFFYLALSQNIGELTFLKRVFDAVGCDTVMTEKIISDQYDKLHTHRVPIYSDIKVSYDQKVVSSKTLPLLLLKTQ